MLGPLLISVYVFVLAMFVGFEVIGKLAPTLHSALLAGLSAIAGVSFLLALYAARSSDGQGGSMLSAGATALAAASLVGGFVLTSRMLAGSKKREDA